MRAKGLKTKRSAQRVAIPADERLTLSLDEVAALLGISRSSAFDYAKAGTLPTIRLSNGRLLVPKVALERLLASAFRTDGPSAA